MHRPLWFATVKAALPERGQIAGIKWLVPLDMANDTGLSIVGYKSRAAEKAATSKAQEILRRWAEHYAAMPKRQAGEVPIKASFRGAAQGPAAARRSLTHPSGGRAAFSSPIPLTGAEPDAPRTIWCGSSASGRRRRRDRGS